MNRPLFSAEDIFRLDAKFAEEGIHLHQRPLRAAMELLGGNFSLGAFGSNEAVNAITEEYRRLIPEVAATWPGYGVGLAASVVSVLNFIDRPEK